MSTYRWNAAESARGYDASAQHIHPYYQEIQDRILARLEQLDSDSLLVDAGGGSGRLVERFLTRFPGSRAIIVDQSEPFLDLARQRLEPFGDRAVCHRARLQDEWSAAVDTPNAIVSMSAIHHLDPGEKRDFYARACSTLAPGGVFLNGDEVRPHDDQQYLRQCESWAAHMNQVMEQGLVHESMWPALQGWQERNVSQFGQPRSSGDDCHETLEAQCGYLADAGFADVSVPWQKALWAILQAVKPLPQ